MARPRTFDPHKILIVARDVFWERGYHATSLDDITAATGVNKPSLYAAFGDKVALFRQILDAYHTDLLRYTETLLQSEPSVRASIRAWLLGFIRVCTGMQGRRGCLSINTTMEAATVDPDVEASTTRFSHALETLLIRTLERGKDAGEFKADFDVAAAARSLLMTYTGMMVLAKQQPSAKLTRAAIEHMLLCLDE